MNWQTVESEITALSQKITDKPDSIIGITRGGVIPARLLSSKLNVKKMHCISVVKNGDARSVVTEITEDLNGKKILLVEDILETGRSLIVAKQYLKEKGAIVRTACLYIMPKTEVTPDYFLKTVDSIEGFPWE